MRQCTFQLQVLEWWQPGCEGELISTFFPHQSVLRHITVAWTSDTRLPTNILPNLASLRGPLLTLIVFTEAMGPGRLLAFDHVDGPSPISVHNRAQRLTKAFSGLRYLRMPSMNTFEDLLRAIRLSDSITLLEITVWDTRVRGNNDLYTSKRSKHAKSDLYMLHLLLVACRTAAASPTEFAGACSQSL